MRNIWADKATGEVHELYMLTINAYARAAGGGDVRLSTLDSVAQHQRSNRQLANRQDDRYNTGQIGLNLNVTLTAAAPLVRRAERHTRS